MKHPGKRQAFTLIEAVVSLSLSSVLLVGVGSSIMLASRALPGDDSVISTNAKTTAIAHDMTTELSTALTISQADPSTITFTVPDRDNNGSPETIRYGWSGTSGAPLTRRYNNDPIRLIATTFDDFSLTYDLDTSAAVAATIGELPFTKIVSIGVDANTSEDSYTVSSTGFCGEYVQPDPFLLPTDATRWKVDRVYFRGKSTNPTSGIIAVELHLPNADRTPQVAIEDSCTVPEGNLASGSWTAGSCDLTSAPWVDVTNGICVILTPAAGSSGDAGIILNQTMSTPVSAYASYLSSPGSSVYAVDDTRSLTGFEVYATVEVTSGSPGGGTTIKRVKISMRATTETNSQVETGAATLNYPAAP